MAYAACVLPLAALVLGVWQRREELARRLAAKGRPERLLVRGLGWLVAATLILFTTGQIAIAQESVIGHSVPLFIGMLAISVLVYLVIVDLMLLLAATGHLFVVFVRRMLRRVVPVFSFLVVYSFLVMGFGTFYAILDSMAGRPQFSVMGSVRPIEFSEAIYFSMVTLSTIGYGDIVPVTSLAQTFVMLEVMFGVVLLLFAFAEIASYDPDAEEGGDGPELGSGIRIAKESAMEPVRWGVISTARIGVAKVLPGMLKSREIKILAIASREEKRAKSWARKLGIPVAYGSYEELCSTIPGSRRSTTRFPITCTFP